MKQFRFSLFMLMLFLTLGLQAQDITVRGVVLDETSEPIIGATVKVGNSSSGTVTDLNGSFSLKVKKGSLVSVSYIGYDTQSVKVTGESMKVILKENVNTLDEVVLVGTVMKKSDLTGAVVGVDAKTLKERPVNNVNEALQGKVAGVFITTPTRPTDDASIRIPLLPGRLWS